MDKILETTLLYDFYGELLTQKQKEVFEMYYLEDLSLSEIGQAVGVTRQAVRDSLKHAESTMLEYDEKLGLIEKFSKEKVLASSICNIADQMCNMELSENMSECIEKIKKMALEILKIQED